MINYIPWCCVNVITYPCLTYQHLVVVKLICVSYQIEVLKSIAYTIPRSPSNWRALYRGRDRQTWADYSSRPTLRCDWIISILQQFVGIVTQPIHFHSRLCACTRITVCRCRILQKKFHHINRRDNFPLIWTRFWSSYLYKTFHMTRKLDCRCMSRNVMLLYCLIKAKWISRQIWLVGEKLLIKCPPPPDLKQEFHHD